LSFADFFDKVVKKSFLSYMARKSRIYRKGAFYHVMLRGNNAQNIFFSSTDRYRLYLLIQQGSEKYVHLNPVREA
jgi:hypothetical protein